MGLLIGLTGCFRPVIPISTHPRYPIDIFYENERPDRPFTEIQALEMKEETPLNPVQRTKDGRMVQRGKNMQEKELLLARLSLQAKRLGADALVNVRYKYYTSATTNGYVLEGVAVKYRPETE
ncbi:hypothetical protein GCM10023189_06110 [Nibrella saemangeumensis]|uniref:YbjQ family protein n=1 Tax=Nibrella saemangeumensis TaxID=1084526 RepID=A0ABP8MF03_9BACT